MIRFWPTIKGLCHRKISLFLQKTVKKISEGSFLKEKYGSGECNQISLKSHNSGFTLCAVARNGFRSFTPVLKHFQMI